MRAAMVLGQKGVFTASKIKGDYYENINYHEVEDFFNKLEMDMVMEELKTWRKEDQLSKWGTMVFVDNPEFVTSTMYVPKGLNDEERRKFIEENDYLVEDKSSCDLFLLKVGDIMHNTSMFEVYAYTFIEKSKIDKLNEVLYKSGLYFKDIVLYDHVRLHNLMRKYSGDLKSRVVVDIRNDYIYVIGMLGEQILNISTLKIEEDDQMTNMIVQLIRRLLRDIKEKLEYDLQEVVLLVNLEEKELISEFLSVQIVEDVYEDLIEQYEVETLFFRELMKDRWRT